MLTEQAARQHLSEVRAELNRLDKDRATLLNLVKNYEEFLQLRAGNGQATVEPSEEPRGGRNDREPRSGTIATKTAIEKVLSERGETLHWKEIVRRANLLGAAIKQNPNYPGNSGIDFQLYALRDEGKIQKVGPGTWRATKPK
jgi:hypothetical protein